MNFDHMRYLRPNIDYTHNRCRQFIKEMTSATNENNLVKKIMEYEQFRGYNISMETLAGIRHSLEESDSYYEEEAIFYDHYGPIMSSDYKTVDREILNSPLRKNIEKNFPQRYFDLLESSLIVDERATVYLQRANSLTTRYNKIMSSSSIFFKGAMYTPYQIEPLLQNPNREYRKEAFKALNKFFELNQHNFDQIYDELVYVYDKTATTLGFKDFVDLKYKLLARKGYGREEVSDFRKKILNNFTPLSVELRKYHRERLGISDPTFIDYQAKFSDRDIKPINGARFIFECMKSILEDLSQETGEFINYMVDNHLIDLFPRPYKKDSTFTASIYKYDCPYIFLNLTGTKDDVRVLAHEIGHAFQTYMTLPRHLPRLEMPSYDAYEIPSFAMEFFILGHMDYLFGEDKFRYIYTELESSVYSLPFCVLTDHFQHLVFENPALSSKERRSLYNELFSLYIPDIDYGDEFLENGTFWHRQSHIFLDPFYSIDFALGKVSAFEYLIKYIKDEDLALKDYINLCKEGGSISYGELLDIGGLQNPLTTNLVDEVMPFIKKILKGAKEEGLG